MTHPGRSLMTRKGAIRFPAYIPVTTFGERYPLDRLLDFADAVTKRDPANIPQFAKAMTDANEAVRYWAVLGCLMVGEKAGAAKCHAPTT